VKLNPNYYCGPIPGFIKVQITKDEAIESYIYHYDRIELRNRKLEIVAEAAKAFQQDVDDFYDGASVDTFDVLQKALAELETK